MKQVGYSSDRGWKTISSNTQNGGIVKGFSLDGITGFYTGKDDLKHIQDKSYSFYLLKKTPGLKDYRDLERRGLAPLAVSPLARILTPRIFEILGVVFYILMKVPMRR